jgi:hypothetical protein
MTDRERAIYEHQADLEHAFLMGFMASTGYHNGETFCYERKQVLQSGTYQKALAAFKKKVK